MAFCEHIGICGGCLSNTRNELKQKREFLSNLFDINYNDIITFASPMLGYRVRAEFRVYRDKDGVFLAMNARRENKRVKINRCHILLPILQETLENLLKHINQSDLLSNKLYLIEVLGVKQSLDSNNVIISLIYHKPLDLHWNKAATTISKHINAHIVGRSKNQQIILSKDYLLERLRIHNKNVIYIRKEGRFCQPNAFINKKMIEFVKEKIKAHKRMDLLELYCGDGNFCIGLAGMFRKVFATEIVKHCAKTIQENAKLNNINNITNARLSGEETIEALTKQRAFFRLKDCNVDDFRFSHILIDPPRSGIGGNVGGGIGNGVRDNNIKTNKRAIESKTIAMLDFIGSFSYIVYISCNPISLKNDIESLRKTHNIQHFAMFNQFPHTEHIESILILHRHGDIAR